jgi:hypothetical protein
MVREASLDAYKHGKFGGTHNAGEIKIKDYLRLNPWATRHEIVIGTGMALTSVSGRCTDLKNKGEIIESSQRYLTPYSKVRIGRLALATKQEYDDV